MKTAIAVCLLAAAGLWGWALFAPKTPEPLPEEFRGAYEVVRFEPPPDIPMDNPFAQGQRWVYEFLEDRTYDVHVFVSDGYEMFRRRGRLDLVDGRLVLRQVSENGEPVPMEPQRFVPRWEEDAEGRVLKLTHDPGAWEIYLRPSSAR